MCKVSDCKCTLCGSSVPTKVAFGLSRMDICRIFEMSVGPSGRSARKDQGVPGYVLFAQMLEEEFNSKTNKKTVKGSRTAPLNLSNISDTGKKLISIFKDNDRGGLSKSEVFQLFFPKLPISYKNARIAGGEMAKLRKAGVLMYNNSTYKWTLNRV